MQQWAHPFFSGGNALKAFRLMRHDHSSPLGADMLKPTLTWNNRTGRLPSPPRRLGGSGTFSANLSAMQGGKWVWTFWGTSLQVVTGELSLLFAAFFYAVRASWKMMKDEDRLERSCTRLRGTLLSNSKTWVFKRFFKRGFGDVVTLWQAVQRRGVLNLQSLRGFATTDTIAIYCYLLLIVG